MTFKELTTLFNPLNSKEHVKNVFWSFWGQFISLGLSLGTSLFAANIVNPEVFGTYKYLLSVVALISLVIMPGIGSAVTQSVVRGFEGTVDYIMKRCFKLGAIASVISIILGIYNIYNNNSDIGYSLILVSVFLPFSEMLFLYDSILAGKKLYRLSSKLNVITSATTSLLLIFSMYVFENPAALLVAFYAGRAISRYFAYIYVKNKIKPNKEIDYSAFKFGLHLSIIKILRSIAATSSNIFIFHIAGNISLAAFTFISMPVDLLKTLFSSVENVAFTKFSDINWKIPKAIIFYKKLLPLIFLLLLVNIIYFLTASFIFKIAFNQYYEYARLSAIYSISIIPSILTMLLLSTLRGGKNTIGLHINNFFNIFCILISIPIIYKYGLNGLVIFLVISKYVEFIIQHIINFKKNHTN